MHGNEGEERTGVPPPRQGSSEWNADPVLETGSPALSSSSSRGCQMDLSRLPVF